MEKKNRMEKDGIKISVVMPAYNCETYIGEAIRSVLDQTFREFELIVVDDGSTDGTVAVVEGYRDARIVLLRNRHDFVESLNRGVRAARGKYIARMDADDKMFPQRLEVQWRTMEEHRDVAVCGTCMRTFGPSVRDMMLGNGYVDTRLLLEGSIVAHPTTMLRKDFLEEHALRYERYECAEDYKLWCEVAKCGGRFWVVPQILLHYRISPGQVSQKQRERQHGTVLKIRYEFLDYLVGCAAVDDQELGRFWQKMKSRHEEGRISTMEFFRIFQPILLKDRV